MDRSATAGARTRPPVLPRSPGNAGQSRPASPAYPQVGPEVRLAQGEICPAGGGWGGAPMAHRRARCRGPTPGARRGGPASPRRPAVPGPGRSPWAAAARTAPQAGQAVRSAAAQGPSRALTRDVHRDRLGLQEEFRGGLAGVLFAVRGDRVLQVDDHHVGARRQRLGHHMRAVAGDVQPGERGGSQRRPPRPGPRFSPGRGPGSVSTASVSAPCGRPAQRIAPGVADSRNRTFCMRSGPRSGSSTVVTVSRAWLGGPPGRPGRLARVPPRPPPSKAASTLGAGGGRRSRSRPPRPGRRRGRPGRRRWRTTAPRSAPGGSTSRSTARRPTARRWRRRPRNRPRCGRCCAARCSRTGSRCVPGRSRAGRTQVGCGRGRRGSAR